MLSKYKKALVTGGAGFVGSHLVEELLNQGLKVISIDDYSAGKEANHDDFKDHPQFTAVKCDITDFERLLPYFEGVDVVFHQAVSKNTVCMKDPRRDLEINAKGTMNVLEAARLVGVKKFLHASTGSVYGDAEYFPTDEKHRVNPNSYYGVSKLAAEKYVRLYAHLYGMDVTMLRYFHVYGPRQDNSDVGGVVSIFARRAEQNLPLIIYGDGTQLRSFTHVKDVVAINLLAAMNSDCSGEVYNCASGIKVTILELAEKVLKHCNKEHLGIEFKAWKPGDVKVFDVDNSKLRSVGFNFSIPFEAGLASTLDEVAKYIRNTQELAVN